MRISILQPGYLPWLGFFEQMYRSDIFIIYDDVQYDKGGWRNRNRIKTSKGAQWLTVPVRINFEEHPLVNGVKIDNGKNWGAKHLSSIKQNYSKSEFFKNYIAIFEEAYSRTWDYLIDIDMYFINKLAACFRIEGKKIVKSSTLGIKGDKLERLVSLCRIFKGDIFYEGSAGRNYIDEDYFSKNDIKVEYQDYKHPAYSQLYGGFIPYLSAIDLLFNHGEKSLSIISQTSLAVKEQ